MLTRKYVLACLVKENGSEERVFGLWVLFKATFTFLQLLLAFLKCNVENYWFEIVINILKHFSIQFFYILFLNSRSFIDIMSFISGLRHARIRNQNNILHSPWSRNSYHNSRHPWQPRHLQTLSDRHVNYCNVQQWVIRDNC